MARVEHEVVICRKVRDVFDFTVDPATVPLWQPSVVTMRTVGDLGVGQRVIQTRSLLGRHFDLEVEIFEFEQDVRFGMRMLSGPIAGTLVLEFAPAAGGTRVTLRADVADRGGVRGILNRVLAEAARVELIANCKRLQDVLETPTA